MKPMRMLILLAVFWAAGSLLLAAESFLPAALKGRSAPKQTTVHSAALVAAPEEAAAGTGAAEAAQEAEKGTGTADTKQDEPKTQQQPAKVEEPAAAKTAETAGAQEGDRDTGAAAAPASGAAAAAKGPSPQRFVPSEQVRADFDVSFPIDI